MGADFLDLRCLYRVFLLPFGDGISQRFQEEERLTLLSFFVI